jgi:hypothetical protein
MADETDGPAAGPLALYRALVDAVMRLSPAPIATVHVT